MAPHGICMLQVYPAKPEAFLDAILDPKTGENVDLEMNFKGLRAAVDLRQVRTSITVKIARLTPEQNRTEQNRTEQNRTEQNRTTKTARNSTEQALLSGLSTAATMPLPAL
jgi:hypothetical protein